MRNILIITAVVIILGGLLAYVSLQDDEPAPLPVAQQPGTADKQPAAPGGTKLAAPDLSKAPTLPKGKPPPTVLDKEPTPDRKEPGTAKVQEPAKAQQAAKAPEKAQVATPVKPPSFDIVRIAKDRTAVVAGRAPAGSTVKLSLGGELLAEVPVSKGGEWVAIIDQPLPKGQTELDLNAVMPDGRSVSSKSMVAIIVPEDKPPVPTAETGTQVADANMPSANSSREAEQATLRAEETARKVMEIANQVERAAKVAEKDPAEAAKMMAKAGSESRAEAAKPQPQGAVAVLLPKTGEAPGKLLQKPEPKGTSSKQLSVDTVEYDDKGNVVVTGTAPKGAKVQTYVDNKPVGVAKAGDDKTWQLKPEKEVKPGSHTLRVDQVDPAGRVVRRIELPFVRVARTEVLATTTARYRVIVQPGNSLWRIARRVYGEGNRYMVIYQANDGQIRNPDMIFPGQVFELPAAN